LRWSLRTWFVLAVVVGVAGRLIRYLLVFPIWGDEAFVAVNFFTRGFAGMLRPLDHSMIVPLGDLWLILAVTRVAGHSEWVLRLPSCLAGMTGLVLFAALARRLLNRHAALAAVALLAASYYPLRHSAEVKPYAIDLLCALAILAVAWQLWQRPSIGVLWAAFGLVTAASVWFSYPSVFVSGGAMMALGSRILERRNGKSIACWLLAGIALTASFAGMYQLVGSKQQWKVPENDYGQWTPHFPPLGEPWRLPLWVVEEHTGNMFAYPNGGPNFGSTATALLVLAGCAALWRRGRRALVLLLLGALPPMFVAAALHKYPYGGSARTTLHLAPSICLLAGAGVVAVLGRFFTSRTVAAGVRVFAAAMLILTVGTVAADVVKPYKKQSDALCRNAVRWMRDNTGPHDRWIVFGAFGPTGRAPDLLQWGGSAARLRYYLLLDREVPLAWAPSADDIAPTRHGRTWVIVYRDNKGAFPEKQWQLYRRRIAERFAVASVREFDLEDGDERLEFYHLGNRSSR
jgi:hypothetical protein